MSQLAAERRILLVGETAFAPERLAASLRDGPVPGERDPGSPLPASGREGSSLERVRFQIEAAATGPEAVQRLEEAFGQKDPLAVVLLGNLPSGEWDALHTARFLLATDVDLQVVIAGWPDENCSDRRDEAPPHSDRLLTIDSPLSLSLAKSCCRSLGEKWSLARAIRVRDELQADYMVDAERVLRTIEACLVELEAANKDLRRYSAELATRLEHRTDELLGTRDLTMFALAQLADSRDPETGEHLERMRAYAQLLARRLAEEGPYLEQVDEPFLEDFYRSTPLHDIGKVGIPDQILLKPGALTPAEFDIMKCHAVIGAEALEKAARRGKHGAFLTMAAEIARYHHEKFDGSGYPHGLVGLAIPLTARITAVADVFDALTSARVYKEAMAPAEARRIIEKESGRHFDPAIVAAFLACYEQFLETKSRIDGLAPAAPPLVVSALFAPATSASAVAS